MAGLGLHKAQNLGIEFILVYNLSGVNEIVLHSLYIVEHIEQK
jgi:hypothetical protein